MDSLSLVELIRSREKTLFILCGLPYSGKTFHAQKLAQSTGALYVSIDELFYARGYDWTTNKLPGAEAWQEIFFTSYTLVREALLSGRNVIYDSTNHTRISRERLREVAREVSAHACVLYVEVPVEVLWSRWSANAEKPTRSVVSRELVEQTIQTFEPPTEDEQVYTILSD